MMQIILTIGVIILCFLSLGIIFEIIGVILRFLWSIVELLFEGFCNTLIFIVGGVIMLWQLFAKTIERRRKYGRQL